MRVASLCLTLLLLVLMVGGSASADLVAHWPLDEIVADTTPDSSGNGNDGTLEGGPAVVAGQLGSALAFNNSRVAIPASDTLTSELFRGSFTLTVWINPTRTGNTWQQIFRSWKAHNTSNDTLFINNDGRLSWRGRVNTAWAGGMCETAAGVVPANQWPHAAVVGAQTNFRIYVNGALTQESAFQITDGTNVTYYVGGDPGSAGESYAGSADDVAIFDHALTEGDIRRAMEGIAPPGSASEPQPADEASEVLRDVVLSWTAGEFAATHDVYFGTSFDDVNAASRANPMGVLASQAQAAASYDPAGLLDFGQTYYWRVDEVNAAPDNTIFTGDVWSFTTELFAYPIQNVIATSNGISEPDAGPENTVNASGLNAADEHSIESDDMWLAKAPEGEALYIQYEFDRVYKLHELLVWNYNVQFEIILGFGLKGVTVEYSENGTDWTVLGDVEFAKATASPTYTANTAVDLGGVPARYVRLMVNSGHGLMSQYGLSEVRFMYIPVQASEPQPADGATNVDVGSLLSWRGGREAVSHEVYLSTDPNALTLAGAVDVPSFDPGALSLGTTYYWQIHEVNEAEAIATWAGPVWSFATQDYIVVDDFESYNDDVDAGTTIFDTWIDGWVNETGSTVGYLNAPFAEQTIVHGGAQAMPLFYDNTAAAVSETEFALDQDWTLYGIRSLSLYFHGAAGNGGRLYVKIDNAKVSSDGPAGDIAESMWMPWNIDLSAVGGNLRSVTSLTIGIEGAGATGTLYIDDIRLYPQVPEFVVPTEPDDAGLVARYTFDGDLNDSVGSHHGVAMGNATIASDPARGQVLAVDGTGDAVDVPYSAELNTETFTVSVWANPDPAGSNYRSPLTSRDDGPQRGYILYLTPTNTWEFWTGTGTGWNGTAGPAAQLSEWTHVVGTCVNGDKALYVNGRLVGESTAAFVLNTESPLRIGGGATEGPGNYFFQGMLDDVRIYNRAMSAEEVAGLAGRTEPLHKPF